MAGTKEPVPGTYQHYKGALYEVIGVAEDTETAARYVVYEALGVSENLTDDPGEPNPLGRKVVRNGAKGALSVCSVARFTELVDGGRDGGGGRVPRFKLVSARPRR